MCIRYLLLYTRQTLFCSCRQFGRMLHIKSQTLSFYWSELGHCKRPCPFLFKSLWLLSPLSKPFSRSILDQPPLTAPCASQGPQSGSLCLASFRPTREILDDLSCKCYLLGCDKIFHLVELGALSSWKSFHILCKDKVVKHLVLSLL